MSVTEPGGGEANGTGPVSNLAEFTDEQLANELARRRAAKPHGNANLAGCQSRLRWAGGTAAKCHLEPGHTGMHRNSSRSWTTVEAETSKARFG